MVIVLNGADFSENNIGHVEIPLVLDDDVKTYLSRLVTADPAFNYDKYAAPLNNFIIGMKDSGLYSKMYLLNLFVGTSKQSQMIPIIDTDNIGMLVYEATGYPMVFNNNGATKNNTKQLSESKYGEWSWFGFKVPVSFYNGRSNGGCVIVGTEKNTIQTLAGSNSNDVPTISHTGRYGRIGTHATSSGVCCTGQNNEYHLFSTININGETKAAVDSSIISDYVLSDDAISQDSVGFYFNLDGFAPGGLFLNDSFNTGYENVAISSTSACSNNTVFFTSCGEGLTSEDLSTLTTLVKRYNKSIGRTIFL